MRKRVLSKDVGDYLDKKVVLKGWVQSKRVHSKVIFFDLRDRSGITQVVFTNDLLETASQVPDESVVVVEGTVLRRPEALINPNIISGKFEVQAEKLEIITLSKPLPFPINELSQVAEEKRLQYRYLTFRNFQQRDLLDFRHRFNNQVRQFLTEKEFIEVETPHLSKSTPEGARDFLVPSRLGKGLFYALPQSPQQYKQLLMVGGLERYFQIGRCFRDEDARGDRQAEFHQIDIEMSFVEEEDVLQLTEDLMCFLVKQLTPEKVITSVPFPRLSYQEAMAQYQSDRPDLRKNKQNNDELSFAFVVDFPLFEWKEQENRYDATHHPFASPKDNFIDNFEKKPKEALAKQYDLVLNGYEVGGGSIRIHQKEILERVFRFLGHSPQKIKDNFGHLLDAFEYGVPPHGGIALGIDRIIMILTKQNSIRDVIAFPKAGDGRDLMMHSPDHVDESQLKELNLKIR